MILTRLFLPLTLVALSLACAGTPAPVAAPESQRAEPSPGYEILWVRDAAEYEAAVVQTYRLAGERLEEAARDREAGTWAVILDADETVISNLEYSIRRAAVGARWSPESWLEWALAKEATAMPGAREFIDGVHRLGGRVAIVTNRSEEVCAATRENLEAVGIRFDHLRCRREGEKRKDSRWREVSSGEGTGLGPLEIVMWLGDNIHDFPGFDQDARDRGGAAFDGFGDRYFVLPNPLYGSWEPDWD